MRWTSLFAAAILGAAPVLASGQLDLHLYFSEDCSLQDGTTHSGQVVDQIVYDGSKEYQKCVRPPANGLRSFKVTGPTQLGCKARHSLYNVWQVLQRDDCAEDEIGYCAATGCIKFDGTQINSVYYTEFSNGAP